MNYQDALQRIHFLESCLKGEETDDDTRGEILDEIASLEERLEELY